MTGWITLGAAIAIWLTGARLALTMLLNRIRCGKGETFLSICREFHAPNCARPIGELRPRTLLDGLYACLIGLAGPVLIVAWLVMRATPATPGEAKRLLAEQETRLNNQAAEIERLQRQIGVTR